MNRFQGVAGSNPAVPIGKAQTGQRVSERGSPATVAPFSSSVPIGCHCSCPAFARSAVGHAGKRPPGVERTEPRGVSANREYLP